MNRSIPTVKGDIGRSESAATGKGIVWAVIGNWVDGTHPHFKSHRNLKLPKGLQHLDYADLSSAAHSAVGQEYVPGKSVVKLPGGAHCASEAGIIAGQGVGSDEDMSALAPEATILSLNIFDAQGVADEFNILAALRAIDHFNERGSALRVHGVLLSFYVGWDRANFACGYSPVCIEVDRLVNSGVVVVAGAGDGGLSDDKETVREGSIRDPGNAELAITVGATHRRLAEIYGASFFSARGPTSDGRRKPDLLAPGERIRVPDAQGDYGVHDGTIYAAAHVAGAAALLMSAQPNLLGKPLEVKALLKQTAVDLGREPHYQGAGLLDVAAAIRAATTGASDLSRQRDAVRVFVSYSHKDKPLFEEFSAHLAALERGGRIKVWSDQLIEGGMRWERAIYDQLDSAEVVLLLVSAYFMQSEFCYTKEFGRAVARGTKVIPIRVRPVTLTGTPLDAIQAWPPDARPVTSFPDPHEAWATVTQKLIETVATLRKS
jgi:subtilisin family serine protease